jgi:hypothetical protein
MGSSIIGRRSRSSPRTSSEDEFSAECRPTWAQSLFRHRGWLVVLLLIVVVSIVRIRLRTMPLERDEGEYAYAGQLMLAGVPPYKLALSMKLPGTYAAYALIMSVFGQSPSGIRLGLLVVNAATIAMVFALGRKVLDQAAGMAAASVFAFFSMSPTVFGLAAHATHFVVAASMAGTLLLLRATENEEAWAIVLSGVLFGIAFLMKQHGVFFAISAGIYLCWMVYERNGFQWARLLRAGGLLLAGWLVPYVVTCLLLSWAGVFRQFIFWTITYAGKYVSGVPVGDRPAQFRSSVHGILGADPYFWILGALASVVMWWEERLEGRRLFLTVFTLCSIASVCAGFYFRGHYFIQLLPALAILCGIGVSRGIYLLVHDKTIELFLGAGMLLLFLTSLVVAVVEFGPLWFDLSPEGASKRIYASSIFGQASAVSGLIRENSSSGTRIVVLGSEPEIYFLSQRRSATGYIYMYPLMETHDLAEKMQAELIRDIESSQPDYLVYVDDDFSWLRRENSDKKLDSWWDNYGSTHYELERSFEITVDPTEDLGTRSGSSEIETKREGAMMLLRRKK